MDFKVAGTKEFVTALQLDTKLDGIPASVLAPALHAGQATPGCTILDVMDEAIDAPGRDVAVRAADHHDQDPGRPDRRGHRAQGQDDQPDPGRDRRRDHHRGRRHDLHRCHRRPEGRGGARDDQRDRQPARCPRSASATSAPSSRPPPSARSCRWCPVGTACCTSRKLRELAGGKRVDNVEDVVKVGDKVQVEIAEIDPRGKLSLIPVSRTDGRRRPSRRRRGRRRRRLTGVRDRRPRRRSARRARSHRRTAGGGLVRRTVLPGGLRVVTEAMPTVRSVTFGIWVGRRLARRGRLARRRARTTSSTCCSRAPQRRDALEISVGDRRGRRRDERVHRQGVHLLLRAGARRRPAARGRRGLRHGDLVADPAGRRRRASAA